MTDDRRGSGNTTTSRDGEMLRCPNPQCGSENHAGKKFCADCGSPLRQVASERRQLTVLFCDVVDSTALASRLDPEDLRELINAYHTVCTEAIDRYGGHVAQYLGDGILVYFGYPRAHEDDAARALRAGLAIVEAVSGLGAGPGSANLRVRIGIHTGQVVTGRVGAVGRQEDLALGETPNVAARVQDLAQPGTVLLTAATYRLVAGLFDCVDQGVHELTGVPGPIQLYHVRSASSAHDRFEAAVQIGLTPLVGRQEELALLRARWSEAKEGQGNVVMLSGEPGIGKSRLVREIHQHVAAENAAIVEFRCSPYHQSSALYPVIEHFHRWLRVERDDTMDTKLAKLHNTLAQYKLPYSESEALLAVLLSWTHPHGEALAAMSPQLQRQRTHETLAVLLVEIAAKKPVFCVWEDLHWADPSTLELLGLYWQQVPAARMFVLCVFRPEFVSPWEPRSYVSHLPVSRLLRRQVEQMVQGVTGGLLLPEAVVAQVAAKTDGVPLFVEELTKSLVESGALTSVGGRYELTTSIAQLAIPTTLSASLTARLDRLGKAKEVAQLGSTIGREFSYDLLRAISPLDEAALNTALEDLVTAELIYQRGRPSGTRYVFKHSLIQDTAYGLLLKSTRQQLHKDIARVIEQKFPDATTQQPELLAHHYTQAGLGIQAANWWQRAGMRALQRSANQEAVTHLQAGLNVLRTVPESEPRDPVELMLQATLGAASMATKGYAAAEVKAVYERVAVLCDKIGDTARPYPALWGLWAYYFTSAQLNKSRDLGEQFVAFAEAQEDPVPKVVAHACLGYTLFWQGHFELAKSHLARGLANYHTSQHSTHIALFGMDCGSSCAALSAYADWMLGYPDRGRASMRGALKSAEENAHALTLGLVLFYASVLNQSLGDVDATYEAAQRSISLSVEQGFPYWLALGNILRGWAQRDTQSLSVAEVEHAFQLREMIGAELVRPYCLALRAEMHIARGEYIGARSVLDDAIRLANANDERQWEAELLRLLGEVSLLERGTVGGEAEADACFRKSIELACTQKSRMLQLRAVTSRARLLATRGDRTKARQELESVYDWFTEGADSLDLRTAKEMLDQL